MSSPESREEENYLYAVLNLPPTASQGEIRERYRALSITFHPDKQHDLRTKEVAAKKFLEIQKAYEVLSDPFLREVYDVLGAEGLNRQWPTELRSKDSEEIKAVLRHWKIDHSNEVLEKLLQPRGAVTCEVNASPLFARGDEYDGESRNISKRLSNVKVTGFGVRHGIVKAMGPKTVVGVTSEVRPGSRDIFAARGTLTGALRHQFSPRLVLELTAAFLNPHIITAKTTYSDNENAVSVQSNFIPAVWHFFPPVTTVSFARRLFRDSSTQGSVTWTYSPELPGGNLEFNVYSPREFDLDESIFGGPGSTSGLTAGVRTWSYGLTLAGLNSCIKAEFSLLFNELSLRLKASAEVGFRNVAYIVSAKWIGHRSAFGTGVGLSTKGVILRFQLTYLEQKWTLPITLTPDYDPDLAFYAVVIPSVALAFGYQFFLKPRRLAQRARYFEDARRALNDEKSELKREIETTTLLLQDVARRRMDAERSRAGLIILEATYGPSPDNEATDLDVDVTVPLQALVHNSQLYISSKTPKSGIPGFLDPAPAAPKSLRIRYLFRDRTHYAEISDSSPVVLPLKDHLVM
ncbi:hypothetical protein BKA82DRAFT_288206 [Pisolithus tinctorius]|uniref:J domain-containing protein n=1 Tax=Pisolithus tinctorius Marx 270 TaxID=870435 RepID=A0A0C3P8F9_PISTI|nr:hypothetical protein BKA82DRAFT_288206 [Pisolithus tinctorius]KIO09750.1 hypothetical protein M404DRAFT_288206 [Pisolithus tinctorius Marx 270]